MKIRECELEFDFNDADDMAKLENAIENTQKKLDGLSTDGKKTSEVIREGCNAIFDCFNEIFGKGSSTKIFGKKTSLTICIEAFKDLINARKAQENSLSDELKEIESIYSPNRATRRANKRGK